MSWVWWLPALYASGPLRQLAFRLGAVKCAGGCWLSKEMRDRYGRAETWEYAPEAPRKA